MTRLKLTSTPAPTGPETISLNMTWRAACQIFTLCLTDGTAEGQASAKAELARMADAADRARELAELVAGAREALRPLARGYLSIQAAPLTNTESAAIESALWAFRILTGDATASTTPEAQGPDSNGHDLPTCRACGWPGSDDHESCPNCTTTP